MRDADNREPDFDDGSNMENTSSAYSLEFIPKPRAAVALAIRESGDAGGPMRSA